MPQDAYLVDRCSEIQEMLQYATEKAKNDARLGGHLAGYISVLISGVVEDCIEHLVVQRSRRSGDGQLQEFVRSSIDQQFRNPRSADIEILMKRFSDSYRDSYVNSVKSENRQALGDIVSNRMSLAHKGILQSPFSVNDVRLYFERVVEILEVVEGILIPSNPSNPSSTVGSR